ncbi:hypothetical protein [Chitiniphilus eburneus]|uniref:Bacteriophage protein n=1 Tax=Chitiniphilus eburneus TaxID=2571148 RepID=A0A4U0QI02_9NEIS|nr:hypothetical protein [Chitiniphilus eburneus]TJZ75584.1 hypothetical protein FAZ21_06620 [Chitiniphilus eburneus]
MATVKITIDDVGKVLGAIGELAAKQVLVGIPSSTAGRDDDGPINNAEIGYVQEHGSPANNVPARPFLVPGVKDEMEPISRQLKRASQSALDGDKTKSEMALKTAGLLGERGARGKISSNIAPALKPSTIANRYRARKTAARRAGEEAYSSMVAAGAQAAGMSLSEIQDAAGIVSLVNTGQLRNALTYVIRKKGD